MGEPHERLAAALCELDFEIDWAALGAAYCTGDARDFFDAALRERVLDVGLTIASRLAATLPRRGPGRSVYVGAAVAELAPILTESVVLGRDVRWINVGGDETRELARALASVERKLGLALPKPTIEPLASLEARSCDHLWMVSVLTDPDAFPALHDELYERGGGALATGRGVLADDRARAAALIDGWLALGARECVLSTTDEELALIEPAARALGGVVRVPPDGVESAVIGDVVRICRWRRR